MDRGSLSFTPQQATIAVSTKSAFGRYPLTFLGLDGILEQTRNTAMHYPRPMSFSDRQYFILSLAECRNLSVACSTGEHHDSELRKKCEKLYLAIDEVAGELVGDNWYLQIKKYPSRDRQEKDTFCF
jgi:hypothetical protein